MKKIKSQCNLILSHLKSGRRIDGITAFKRFDILGGFRARSSDLRKQGHDIRGEFIKTKSGKIYKSYYMNNNTTRQ